MLIVIILIAIMIVAIGWILDDKLNNTIGPIMVITGTPVIIFSFIMLIGLIGIFPYNIDKKFAMYEEQNSEIETKIKQTVQSYMKYEEETYKHLVETSDLETLLINYPQLNSNELVKSEIETYKENNRIIRKLKEEQIDKPTIAWWLYFGK